MWQHVDTLLSLKTISKLTARSTRSVHYAFTSSFGFGPLTYFKILRLNAVRKALCDPCEKTAIIDIAAERLLASRPFWNELQGIFRRDAFANATASGRRNLLLKESTATSVRALLVYQLHFSQK